MKKLILISFLLLAAAMTTDAQRSNLPKLTGLYLGQKPLGIFSPQFVLASGTTELREESVLTFSVWCRLVPTSP